jgi:chromosome segregation ATPase
MKDKVFILIVVVLVGVLFSIIFLSPSPSGRRKAAGRQGVKTHAQKNAAGAPAEASNEQLQEEITQAKAMVSALVGMNATLKKNNASLDESVKRLQESLGKANDENANLKSTLDDTTSKRDALVKEMTSLRVVVDELKESTGPIKLRLKDIAAGLEGPAATRDTKRQLRSLDEKLSSIDSDIARLIKENNAYRISAQNLQGLLSDKNKELDSLKKQAAGAGPEKDNLKSQISALSRELEQIKKNKSIFEDTISELNKKNASLNEELGRLNAMVKGKSEAPKQLAQAIKERDEAIKSKQDLEASIAALNAKNEQLERTLNATRAQLDGINKEYGDFKAQYNAAKESSAAGQTELAKRADEILRLRDKLIVSDAKTDELKSAISNQEKETANLRERFVGIQMENENLKDELSQTKNKLNDLKAQLSQIADMNNSLQGRLQEIGGMLKGAQAPAAVPVEQPAAAAAPAPEPVKEQPAQLPENKKVNVELVPQQ